MASRMRLKKANYNNGQLGPVYVCAAMHNLWRNTVLRHAFTYMALLPQGRALSAP